MNQIGLESSTLKKVSLTDSLSKKMRMKRFNDPSMVFQALKSDIVRALDFILWTAYNIYSELVYAYCSSV